MADKTSVTIAEIMAKRNDVKRGLLLKMFYDIFLLLFTWLPPALREIMFFCSVSFHSIKNSPLLNRPKSANKKHNAFIDLCIRRIITGHYCKLWELADREKNIVIVVCFRNRDENRQLKSGRVWPKIVWNTQRAIRVLTHSTRFRAVGSIRSEIVSRECSWYLPRYSGRPLVQGRDSGNRRDFSFRPNAFWSTYIHLYPPFNKGLGA